jgi:hypothetical protein
VNCRSLATSRLPVRLPLPAMRSSRPAATVPREAGLR